MPRNEPQPRRFVRRASSNTYLLGQLAYLLWPSLLTSLTYLLLYLSTYSTAACCAAPRGPSPRQGFVGFCRRARRANWCLVRAAPRRMLAAALLRTCLAAAPNATSPGSDSAHDEELVVNNRIALLERELRRARESAAAHSKAVSVARSARRSRELSSLHRLVAQDPATEVAVGNESVCVAVPCAPKHWPLVPRVMRSVAQQSLTPHKVVVALSHTNPAACAAKQAELSAIQPGATLHCVAGSGWTRGKNRNLAAAACGNVSLVAHLLTYWSLTHSTYSLTDTHDGLRPFTVTS